MLNEPYASSNCPTKSIPPSPAAINPWKFHLPSRGFMVRLGCGKRSSSLLSPFSAVTRPLPSTTVCTPCSSGPIHNRCASSGSDFSGLLGVFFDELASGKDPGLWLRLREAYEASRKNRINGRRVVKDPAVMPRPASMFDQIEMLVVLYRNWTSL